MNILVGAPNPNFDLQVMKAKMLKHPGLMKEHLYFTDQNLSQAELDSIDVIIGYDSKLVPAIIDNPNNRLKWIQSLSVGIDYFPLDEIKARGIRMATVKGIHSEPIAETVLGMILGQYRNLNRMARIRSWQKPANPFKILADRTVAIYGTGSIGTRIAEMLKVFDVNVIGINHSGHAAKHFDETFAMQQSVDAVANADVIINSLPLIPDTDKFFNHDFFSQLKRQPLFINVGRGGSVVTDDLIASLEQHQLSAASLDVMDPEPYPSNSPLWQMDNVFISPHIASLFDQYGEQALEIFSKNLREYEYDGSLLVNEVQFKS
ncbi:NAD(P)-dependent oxidoreductase [Nicoliella lavandulae]|uniref:NAD(P)-dependent oxidoreductase n=1 Tax=Nicoliella lavandulae TaxID=3082954 RepID=A0ABU8SMN0_9LACO